MIRFFKSPQPAALFSIPLIVIALWGEYLFDFKIYKDAFTMPLWSLLESFFTLMPSWLNLLLFCALVSFEAIYLNLLINKYEVLYRNSYLPALFFVLFVSSFPDFQVIHPVHFVNLILLKVFDKIFTMYNPGRAVATIFDCGFLAALAALLYLPALPLLLLLMIAISLLRSFNIREWLVLLIGYSLPFIFLSVYEFWNYELLEFWQELIARIIQTPDAISLPSQIPGRVLAAILFFILALALFRLRANYYKNIIRVRTYQQIQFLFFLTGIGSFYLSKEMVLVHWLLLAIPVSIWFAYFFVSQKKRMWIAEGLLWILIAAIVWNHLIE
jgi:hypothetical protein